MPEESSAGDGPEKHLDAGGTLRSQAALSTYSTAVQGAARLVYSLLVGHLGSRELLGQTNTSLSLSVLSSQLWGAPAGMAGTRYVAARATLHDREGAAVVARHLAARSALVAMVLPTGVAFVGSRWLGFGTAHTVGTVLLAFSYSMYTTLRGIQFGALRFRHVATWDTIAGATAIATVTIVLALDLTWLTLLPLTAGYALFAVVSWPSRTEHRVESVLRRKIDRFVVFGAISGLASGGLLQLSQLAAHWWAGPAQAGDFAAALALATPASMLSIALATVLVPPLVAAAGRGDRAGVHRHSDAIARRLTAIFVGLFGVLVIVTPVAVTVMWGEEFRAVEDVLPTLLVAVMLTSIGLGAATTLLSTRARGPRAVAGLNLAGFGASIVVWPQIAPALGIRGVAVGYLVGAAVASLGVLITVWWVERHHWWDLAARLVVGTALFVALARLVRDLDEATGVLAQVGAAAAFAFVWVALNRREFAALWRTARGGGSDRAA